jgi:hypothetical protein
MRTILGLAIIGTIAISGAAEAASDPVKFCGAALGLTPDTPKYTECQQMLEKLDAAAKRDKKTNDLGEPAADDNLTVTFESAPNSSGLYMLVITSREDSLTIRNIRVNRGNCLASEQNHAFKGAEPLPLPVTLKFGERFALRWFYPHGCVPVEMDVSTDKGDYTFSNLR